MRLGNTSRISSPFSQHARVFTTWHRHYRYFDTMSLKTTLHDWGQKFSLGSRAACMGLTLGWPESSLSYFLLSHCDEETCDLTSNGSATVRMTMTFGSCLGALIPPCIADRYGRKTTFIVAGISNFLFWVILGNFDGYTEAIIGAIVGGLAAGVFLTTSALYVSEISLPQSRGSTGALTAFSAYVGVLFGSLMIFVTYTRVLALIMAGLTVIFLMLVQFSMIESPHFLFIRGKTLDAKLSLKALRGANSVLDIDPEYRSIEMYFNKSRPATTGGSVYKILTSSHRGKHAMLVIVFLSITQMVGAYGMDDFSKKFFDIVMPDYGRTIIAFLDVFSVVVCLYTIEKFGRKPLLLAISIVGSSISCLILAVWSFSEKPTHHPEEDVALGLLVPSTIICLYYTVYSLGLTPIMPILTAEICPSRDKTMAVGFCISVIYFSSMIIQNAFELLSARKDSDLAFGSFAVVGALGIPVIFIFIPETKGKTLLEIQNELENCTVIVSS